MIHAWVIPGEGLAKIELKNYLPGTLMAQNQAISYILAITKTQLWIWFNENVY